MIRSPARRQTAMGVLGFIALVLGFAHGPELSASEQDRREAIETIALRVEGMT